MFGGSAFDHGEEHLTKEKGIAVSKVQNAPTPVEQRSIEGGVPQAVTKDSTVHKKAVPQNRLAKGAIIAICGVMQVVRTKLSRLVEPSAKSPRYHPGFGGPGSLARHICYSRL